MKYLLLAILLFTNSSVMASQVRLKDLARIEQSRDQSLVGYGLVLGLAGSGDSARNKMTVQSLSNTLSRFGLKVTDRDISSRNVAAVMVTAKLGSYSEVGGKFDVDVSSIGDATSLTGGNLLLAPLNGIDGSIFGFAQGQLTVGGYDVKSFNNGYRKNHATSAKIVLGGTLERSISESLTGLQELNVVLNEPDFTTVQRLSRAIKGRMGELEVYSEHPGKIKIKISSNQNAMSVMAQLENLTIEPDSQARVVINEKTGTIVAGSEVRIDGVTIAHGDLKIEVTSRLSVSQPENVVSTGNGISSVAYENTKLNVDEERGNSMSFRDGTSVAELVISLNKLKLSTRDMITIIQSIKAAGALHAELVIQ